MAIKPCKECGAPVSDKAESCPMCGAKQKKKTSMLAWFGLVLLVLAGIGMYAEKSIDSRSSTQSSATKILQNQPPEANTGELKNWQYETSKVCCGRWCG